MKVQLSVWYILIFINMLWPLTQVFLLLFSPSCSLSHLCIQFYFSITTLLFLHTLLLSHHTSLPFLYGFSPSSHSSIIVSNSLLISFPFNSSLPPSLSLLFAGSCNIVWSECKRLPIADYCLLLMTHTHKKHNPFCYTLKILHQIKLLIKKRDPLIAQ